MMAMTFVTAITWNSRENRDYGSNDISDVKNGFSLTDCKYSCETTARCVGIVVDYSDDTGPGKCFLKSAFVNSSIKNGPRYTYKMFRS